ncbi:hypothetical protein VNI00_008662 [Paramarasmius palmivorus]|uniref:F-box domain-containing protein n=1 Tax=Paramarasmius palmivorus TaxID=297713 RepID=A0AAW0CVZ1_9AGAR
MATADKKAVIDGCASVLTPNLHHGLCITQVMPSQAPQTSSNFGSAPGRKSQPLDRYHPLVDLRILRLNQLPSETEAAQTRAYLEVEVEELGLLEQEVERVGRELKELKKHRDKIRQKVQRRRSWLSPIRRLSLEILGKIFAFACLGDLPDHFSLVIRSDTHSSRSDSSLPKRSIATTCRLSQVCHHWRNIITSSPRLWSSLSLDVTDMKDNHADLVALYLTRSAEHPLRIDIHEAFNSFPEDYLHPDSVVAALGRRACQVFGDVMKELYRCIELHYGFGTENLIAHIEPERFTDGFPLLRSFYTNVAIGRVRNPATQWFWTSIRNASNLTSLTCIQKCLPREYLPMHARAVTIIHPDHYPLLQHSIECLSLLRIRSLDIHDFRPLDIIDYPSYLPIITQHISNISITTDISLSELYALFASLTVPALYSLKITTHNGDRMSSSDTVDKGLATLRTMFLRSSCSLQVLELRMPHSTFSSHSLISMLQAQPSLAQLTLEAKVTEMHPSILPELCSRMTLSAQDATALLLPNLRHLFVHDSYTWDPSDLDKSFEYVLYGIEMLESRQPGRLVTSTLDIPITAMEKHILLVDLVQGTESLACRRILVWKKPPTLIPIPGQKSAPPRQAFRTKHATEYNGPSLSSKRYTSVELSSRSSQGGKGAAAVKVANLAGSLAASSQSQVAASTVLAAQLSTGSHGDSWSPSDSRSGLEPNVVALARCLEKTHERLDKLKRKLDQLQSCLPDSSLLDDGKSTLRESNKHNVILKPDMLPPQTKLPLILNLADEGSVKETLENTFKCELKRLPPCYGLLPDRAQRIQPLRLSYDARIQECLGAVGYERMFQQKLSECSKLWKQRYTHPLSNFFYPTRTFWLDEQRCLVIGPMSQYNTQHDFTLRSSFDSFGGEERPLFYDSGPHKCRMIYYGGTYKAVKITRYPQGFQYQGGNLTFKNLANAVMSCQVGGPALRYEEVLSLLKAGEIRLEFACLYCVGFDRALYTSLTLPKNHYSLLYPEQYLSSEESGSESDSDKEEGPKRKRQRT